MKKSRKTSYQSSFKNQNNASFKRLLNTLYIIKDAFSFDEFTFLKAENEKLQIVFANIRV